jgi:hypothetical protein
MILRILIGLAAGGGLGFGWHKLVGCSTGACPIVSNPWLSIAYGAAIGVLIATNVR